MLAEYSGICAGSAWESIGRDVDILTATINRFLFQIITFSPSQKRFTQLDEERRT